MITDNFLGVVFVQFQDLAIVKLKPVILIFCQSCIMASIQSSSVQNNRKKIINTVTLWFYQKFLHI